MLRIILAFALAALLTSCSTQVVSQEQCTPQYPPGPCAGGDMQVPKGK